MFQPSAAKKISELSHQVPIPSLQQASHATPASSNVAALSKPASAPSIWPRTSGPAGGFWPTGGSLWTCSPPKYNDSALAVVATASTKKQNEYFIVDLRVICNDSVIGRVLCRGRLYDSGRDSETRRCRLDRHIPLLACPTSGDPRFLYGGAAPVVSSPNRQAPPQGRTPIGALMILPMRIVYFSRKHRSLHARRGNQPIRHIRREE